jgi:uncharacterized protein (DUF1810 family)
MNKPKKYDLERFVSAQAGVYPTVLAELRSARKDTHWMWYIFPQLTGLGHNAMAKFYALTDVEEAQQYLDHPLLGKRLRECCEVLLSLKQGSITDIMGYPDNLKLCSCMTLFESISDDPKVFTSVLKRYYNGHRDPLTLDLLEKSPV